MALQPAMPFVEFGLPAYTPMVLISMPRDPIHA